MYTIVWKRKEIFISVIINVWECMNSGNMVMKGKNEEKEKKGMEIMMC